MRKFLAVLAILVCTCSAYAVEITEEDGSPSIHDPWKVKHPNNSVTVNSDYTVSVSEADPKVGTLVNTKWCNTDGTVINCDQNAPGGAEVNNLETVVTDILTTEILVGTGADTGNYVVMSSEATMDNAGAVTLANDALDDQYYDSEADLTGLLDDDYVDEDQAHSGEVTGVFGSMLIADSVAVSSWNLTTPTITTSLTTSTPTTLTATELDRLDGLAGIISTDATAVTDLEGTLLSITGSTLNATEADTLQSVTDRGATATNTITVDGVTMSQDENITLGTQTLDWDGTDFVFSDTLSVIQGTNPSYIVRESNKAQGFKFTTDASSNKFESIGAKDWILDAEQGINFRVDGAVAFTADYDNTGDEDVFFRTDGTAVRMYIKGGGNVGIGPDTTPDTFFDVQGAMHVDGAVTTDSTLQIDSNMTIGAGAAGIDYTVTFDGETNDGVLTYMEDEDRLDWDATLKVTTAVDLPELGNTLGDLKIQPDVQGDVTFFEDTQVGDAVDGKSVYIYRNAAEGTTSFRLYGNQWQNGGIIGQGFGWLELDNQGGGLYFNYNANGSVEYFTGAGSGENRYISQDGYITAVTAPRYIRWTINDTTDNFELTRESSDIGNFDIQLPLIADGITASGTVEGATITEGGNAVYNSSETPGGELGGTWASPTVDSAIHDDEYVELGDNFVGDVTGPYSATVVGNDSHTHAAGNITGTDAGTDLTADLEEEITAGTTAQFYRGDKTFSSTLVGTLTADGLTLGANENITLGAQTLDHDGTDFVFSDDIHMGTGGQITIGSAASDATKPIYLYNTYTATGSIQATYINPIYAPSGAVTGSHVGVGGYSTVSGTSSEWGNGDHVYGLQFGPYVIGTSLSSGSADVVGIETWGARGYGGARTFVGDTATGLKVAPIVNDTGVSFTFDDIYGIKILNDFGVAITEGTRTNQYQLYIEEPEIATNEYQVYLVGSGTDTGIHFASNAHHLYSNGTDMFISNLTTGTGSAMYYSAATDDIEYAASSRRYKTDIKDFTGDFKNIYNVQPRTYKRKDTIEEVYELGYIAEEIEALGLSGAVGYDVQGRPDYLNDRALIIYAVEAIKDLNKRITELEELCEK